MTQQTIQWLLDGAVQVAYAAAWLAFWAVVGVMFFAGVHITVRSIREYLDRE